MNCSCCGYPARPVICVSTTCEFLNRELDSASWIQLDECPLCHTLWQAIPYEPHASYFYRVPWPYDVAFWREIHDIDNGSMLVIWHEAVLVNAWHQLLDEDKARAKHHYEDSYVHAPYFRVLAPDEAWQGYVYKQKLYSWRDIFDAEEIQLLSKRVLPIPDLKEFHKSGKYVPLQDLKSLE